jgi:RimJ/RimL family protein N-acetyltransferase
VRHDIVVNGLSLRLRPVAEADAALIARLRADPSLSRWIHAGDGSVERQRQWLAAYFERPGDVYWAVEPLDAAGPDDARGFVSVYDIDVERGDGEWGRWVLRPGSNAALESAWLMYRAAFTQLRLRAVHSRTVADNAAVVSFHDSCGIPQRRLLPAAVQLQGAARDMVEHRLTVTDWPAIDQRLGALAARLARRRTPVTA